VTLVREGTPGQGAFAFSLPGIAKDALRDTLTMNLSRGLNFPGARKLLVFDYEMLSLVNDNPPLSLLLSLTGYHSSESFATTDAFFFFLPSFLRQFWDLSPGLARQVLFKCVFRGSLLSSRCFLVCK
jgi:hypothetical protein